MQCGKYLNKREFVALAGELGLAWPQGQRPHPVIGFSEVQLTEQTVADYADTLAYLGAAIRLYRDTFRRLGLLGGQGDGEGQEGQDGDGQQPTGKAGERFKVACGCQPPRSFWIRAKQYTPGPITRGICGQDFHPPGRRPPVPGWIATWHAAGVKRRRGSEPGPDRPGRRLARARVPPGVGEACLADAGPARSAPRS
jgi:hypothetical protein